MRKVINIALRDFRSYMYSLIGYFLLFAFLVIVGIFFVNYLVYFIQLTLNVGLKQNLPTEFNLNEYVIEGVFWLINFLLLFIVPFVTMRTFAEEKRHKTFSLLLTSPLTFNQIFLGKFLGAYLFLVVVILATIPHILVVIIAGNPDIGPILTGYLGVLLLVAGYVSIGVYISSLFENQIVAAIFTFGALFFLYVISFLSGEGTLSSVFNYLSTSTHIESFFKGLIKTKDIVYFVLMFLLGWILTYRKLEAIKWRG